MTMGLGRNQRRVLRIMLLRHEGWWPNSFWATATERQALMRLEKRGLVVLLDQGYHIPDHHNEAIRDELGIEL